MSEDFVPEDVPRRAVTAVPHRMPLDQLDDVDGVVERVVAMRVDQARIVAAKFSSFI